MRKQLNIKEDQKTLLIYDIFKVHTTGAVSELLEKNNIISKNVPANETEFFQPLDLSVNKSSKCFVSDKYQTRYVDQVAAQLGWGIKPEKVDIRLLVKDPSQARWVVEFYHHMFLSVGKKIVKNEF